MVKSTGKRGSRKLGAVLIGILVSSGSATAGDWPTDPGLDPVKREAVDAVMEIVLAECPAIGLATYWQRLPRPGSDPHWAVNWIGATNYDPPGKGWDSAPVAVPAWRVGVGISHQVNRDGDFLAIIAGGPDDAGLLVRAEGGFLGAEECNLTEEREGGFRFRSVPALADPLERLSR